MQDQEQQEIKCKNCGYLYRPQNIYWDEKGYGYSTKLCNCPNCKRPNVIKYYEDGHLDLNKDTSWYNYYIN